MMAELVDSHTHLNSTKFQDDVGETIERAHAAGVTRLINMGDTLASSARAVELAAQYGTRGVYAAVGIHPEEAFELTGKEDAQLADWTRAEHVVAIGEIGLDYYWEKDEERRALQRRIFVRQLDLARQLHLPVCIHDREAHGDTLAILKKEGRGIEGVLHCFSGSLEMAKETVKLGYHLGVDGPLTYKNAAKLPEIVQKIPLEWLLVETDAPYMTPVPFRGKRNEPAYVRYVAEKMAAFRGIPFEAVAEATTANAVRLYHLA
ncbi:TatD family hydrolase [Mitsuokella sp. oral taxon 131]|uniref:TatD family hydrolase n=1 Tax=Mitsuokella sp. oral taxon 131 TaxID=1321780 RepID=UPI0003ADC35E|nr:TatD family hydrolase [Mitsuokella sp. oral taxon 131]ERL04899.1 hydrolase, TatD family [Mitsuokella sp. oral taxon 131 str. W9106]